MNVPNLDAMEGEELWRFYEHRHRVRFYARHYFPDRPRGYVKAMNGLTLYAANKAVAQTMRLNGLISRAQEYEKICERIYNDLPEWARW